jgi:GMP synthase (glutamine-hydrolysing)
MLTAYPRIAVIHHLQQPFLGHAAVPLGAVEEHFGGSLPALDGLDGIVSFGGEDSSWEPQFAPELELIREGVRREIPFLGVCLGAQLLALAHGGEVSRLQRRLVAWVPLTPLTHDDDPIVDALPAGAHGLHWNQDGIEPPPAATELLERPQGGRAEAFRIGRLAWGVQFHPELDQPALDGWYAEWSDLLEPAGVTEPDARAADARHMPAQAALSTAIFGAFVRVVRERAGRSAHA